MLSCTSMYIFVYIYIYIIIIPPKDIKTFQLFIGEATVNFGYIQFPSFALKRAVNKVHVLYCIVLILSITASVFFS